MVNEYISKADASDWLKQYGQDVLHGKYKFSLMYIWKNIMDMPSADVVQVRHGRWKKIGSWGRVYRCNQCGNFLDFDGVNAGRGSANFCPNCGAKMDNNADGTLRVRGE